MFGKDILPSVRQGEPSKTAEIFCEWLTAVRLTEIPCAVTTEEHVIPPVAVLHGNLDRHSRKIEEVRPFVGFWEFRQPNRSANGGT